MAIEGRAAPFGHLSRVVVLRMPVRLGIIDPKDDLASERLGDIHGAGNPEDLRRRNAQGLV